MLSNQKASLKQFICHRYKMNVFYIQLVSYFIESKERFGKSKVLSCCVFIVLALPVFLCCEVLFVQ